jgi:hypothetical protein
MRISRSLVRRLLFGTAHPGVLATVFAVAAVLLAVWWRAGAQDQPPVSPSKFTLARIRYSTADFGAFGSFGRRRRGWMPPWSHDYPTSEKNFSKILAEVSRIDTNEDGHIVSFDSEEVFRYPIAYLCEVGYLDLNEDERHNMGEYLLRGGFLIVDDFRGERALENFKEQLRLVFPDRALEELPRSHPIFTCFYDVSNLYLPPPPIYRQSEVPQYFGMSDDRGRLMMVVDYNNDISEYWEWTGDPFFPISDTNEAYKYGVNYVMYALTH